MASLLDFILSFRWAFLECRWADLLIETVGAFWQLCWADRLTEAHQEQVYFRPERMRQPTLEFDACFFRIACWLWNPFQSICDSMAVNVDSYSTDDVPRSFHANVSHLRVNKFVQWILQSVVSNLLWVQRPAIFSTVLRCSECRRHIRRVIFVMLPWCV